MTEKRFKLGYVCGDYGLIDNEKDNWTDFHSMSENSEKNVQICIRKMNELAEENERLKKQNKQTTEILENGGVILTKHQLTSIIEMKNNEESSEIRYLKTTNAKLKDEIKALKKENEQLKDILKDITIQLDANHTMNTYQMVIPINRVIYNELNRRLKETSFNEELRRFLE